MDSPTVLSPDDVMGPIGVDLLKRRERRAKRNGQKENTPYGLTTGRIMRKVEKQLALPVHVEDFGSAPACPVDQTEMAVRVFLSFEGSVRLNNQVQHKEKVPKCHFLWKQPF